GTPRVILPVSPSVRGIDLDPVSVAVDPQGGFVGHGTLLRAVMLNAIVETLPQTAPPRRASARRAGDESTTRRMSICSVGNRDTRPLTRRFVPDKSHGNGLGLAFAARCCGRVSHVWIRHGELFLL